MKALKFLQSHKVLLPQVLKRKKKYWSPVQIQLLNNAVSNDWVGCVLSYTEGSTSHLTVDNAQWTLLSRVHVSKHFSFIHSTVKHANRIDSCDTGNTRELLCRIAARLSAIALPCGVTWLLLVQYGRVSCNMRSASPKFLNNNHNQKLYGPKNV